jgi:mannose/fructose/N-acetylgalactosamine-specific phosphotransferase system component IID
VLCVACGYDLRTGKRLEVAAPSDGEAEEEEPESQSKLAGAARGARSFLLGCVLSMLGALIGAVVWFVVAWLTGYESGWIAWGLGALTGLGMLLGSQRDNELSGITAAFISIVGILAAKWLIFAQVLLPIIRAAEEMAPGQLPSTTKLFFQTMFDVIDGLFVLFAFFTAYWFGTGRGHGD